MLRVCAYPSDGGDEIVTDTWVVAIGVAVSVAAYFAKNFVLQPMLEYRAVKGRVQNRLKYYANVITNSGLPDEMGREASAAMRNLSCDLEEAYYAIGLHDQLSRLRVLPSRAAISGAATSLIYLSNAANTVGSESRNDEELKSVRQTLRILA